MRRMHCYSQDHDIAIRTKQIKKWYGLNRATRILVINVTDVGDGSSTRGSPAYPCVADTGMVP
jgi:hypothetical protein